MKSIVKALVFLPIGMGASASYSQTECLGLDPKAMAQCIERQIGKMIQNPSGQPNNSRPTLSVREDFFNKKWSIGDLPCNTNGGSYIIYTNRPPSGDSEYLGGKHMQSEQRQDYQFKIIDNENIEYTRITYAEGNQGMVRMVRDPNTVVAKVVSRFRLVSRNKLEFESTILSIDFEALRNGNIRYQRQNESGTRVLCP